MALRNTLSAFAMLVSGAAAAQAVPVDVVPNFVGAGIGVTTQWLGSKDYVVGIVPGARVQLSGQRFLEVYGAIADANLLDDPNWELGPMGQYRIGRKNVKDPVVGTLPEIDGGLEAGGFAGWHYLRTEGIPFRVRFGLSATTAISGGATGSHVTPYASLWIPLSYTVFVGVGGGLTWSSASFMQQRFGVTPEGSAASGLPAFSAGAGVRQVYAWPALLVKVTPSWYVGGGAFWQRLTGDAAASPIVAQRGDRNQFTAGVGLGYSW